MAMGKCPGCKKMKSMGKGAKMCDDCAKKKK